jgi:methionyl aminopeptidase
MLQQFGVYGYGRNENMSGANLRLASAKSLLKTIDANFGSIVFSRRYLERLGVKNYHLGVSNTSNRDGIAYMVLTLLHR